MDSDFESLRQKVDVIQSMIDISSDRLEALRTQCLTSAELTQEEIRKLETKLVKMFSELLIAKVKLTKRLSKGLQSTGSELKQWLKVVGLSEGSLDAVWQRVSTLELLLDKSNGELRQLIQFNPEIEENEILRWQRAMFNLKRCHQAMSTDNTVEQCDFSWTYWDGIHQIPDSVLKTTETDATHVPPLSSYKRGPLIAHRFTKKFRALSTCDFCNKQMFFGLKCIECKYSCHKDCEASVPPSCGVPVELMTEFKQTFNLENSNCVPEIVDAGNGFFFSTRVNNKKKPSVSMPSDTNLNWRPEFSLYMTNPSS